MADRFPLIFDTDNNQLKELPVGDNLNLQGSSIVNVSSITCDGFVTGKRRLPIYNNTVFEASLSLTLTANDLNKIILVRTDKERTITLPAPTGLQVGDWIKISDIGDLSSSDNNQSTYPNQVRGNSYRKNIIIKPQSASIQGDSESLIVDVDGKSVTLVWCGSSYNWRIIN